MPDRQGLSTRAFGTLLMFLEEYAVEGTLVQINNQPVLVRESIRSYFREGPIIAKVWGMPATERWYTYAVRTRDVGKVTAKEVHRWLNLSPWETWDMSGELLTDYDIVATKKRSTDPLKQNWRKPIDPARKS